MAKKQTKINVIGLLEDIEALCKLKELKLPKIQQFVLDKLARLKNGLKKTGMTSMELSSHILKTKQNLIEEVKQEKSTNQEFLKDIINRLEEIELQLSYEIIPPEKNKNFSLVEYLLFEIKDIKHSELLIKKYPYLINAYSQTNNNILKVILNKYQISLLECDKKENKKNDIYYYEFLLVNVLKNEKIIIDKDYIKNFVESLKLCHYNNKFVKTWQTHLINYLNTHHNYKENVNNLKEMYQIRDYFKQDAIRNMEYHIEHHKPMKQAGSYIFSIDGEDTYNRDDALEITKDKNGNYDIYIYVADPLAIFPFKSKAIQEVRHHNKSRYYGRETAHIFPVEIITGYLSLDQGKRRPSRIHHYKVSPSGEIIFFEIKKGTIVVKNNLTYPEMNKKLQNPKNEKDFRLVESILSGAELLIKQAPKSITGILKHQEESNNLVAFYMLFNNFYVANYFKEKGYPLAYRAHNKELDLKSFKEKFNLTSDQEYYDHFIKICEDILYPVTYSLNDTYHKGLNMEAYASISNGNREFESILNLYCEDVCYFDKNPNLDKLHQEIEKEIKYLNERRLAIEEYDKKVRKRKFN